MTKIKDKKFVSSKSSTSRNNSWKIPFSNLVKDANLQIQEAEISHKKESTFLIRSHGGQRNWYIFLQVLKDLSTWISILSKKISFKNEKEIKTFSDEGKVRELVFNRPILK